MEALRYGILSTSSIAPRFIAAVRQAGAGEILALSSRSAEKAREKAGFTGGTQLAKIRMESDKSDNLSGVRGVYYDGKRGKYRARIKFKRKIYNLGYFTNLEDAIKARKRAEEDIFEAFLEANTAAEET